MKTLKRMALLLLALAGVIALMQSCSKDEEMVPQTDENPGWTVRPDFTTLDTRPPQVIEQFSLTGDDTEPVMVMKSASQAQGGKYALVIGISDYTGTANDLKYCDDDAIDWKARLQTEGYNVTSLLDLNATKANIEAAVNNLASLAVADNEIVFCYSGHGGKGNIVSTDLYYISSSWFKTKFANATTKKMFFCLDACQIGSFGTALNATGRIIALASNKTSLSYDGDATMKNGVFTYYQMVGFDMNGYNYVEPDCQFACDQMKVWASQWHVKVAPSFVDSFPGNFDL